MLKTLALSVRAEDCHFLCVLKTATFCACWVILMLPSSIALWRRLHGLYCTYIFLHAYTHGGLARFTVSPEGLLQRLHRIWPQEKSGAECRMQSVTPNYGDPRVWWPRLVLLNLAFQSEWVLLTLTIMYVLQRCCFFFYYEFALIWPVRLTGC